MISIIIRSAINLSVARSSPLSSASPSHTRTPYLSQHHSITTSHYVNIITSQHEEEAEDEEDEEVEGEDEDGEEDVEEEDLKKKEVNFFDADNDQRPNDHPHTPNTRDTQVARFTSSSCSVVANGRIPPAPD